MGSIARMPKLTVLSWNCQGGDIDALVVAITYIKPDIVALQEAPKTGSKRFDLSKLENLPGYSGSKVDEFETLVVTGAGSTSSGFRVTTDTTVKAYYLMVRSDRLKCNSLKLLNYTKEPVFASATSAFKATSLGFSQRPPALAILQSKAGRNIHLWMWHAPIGHWNKSSLSMFDGSEALQKSTDDADLTIIAGDLNTRSVSSVFDAFAGIRDGAYDYILATNPDDDCEVEDGRKTAGFGKVLDALAGDAHSAVLGVITF